MLLPDKDGMFSCKGECDFNTGDVFDMLDHAGVEFTWAVKISENRVFDLFDFLRYLSDTVNEGDLEGAYMMIQDTATAFVNASSNELEQFIEESIVADETDNGIKSIERMLRDAE
jgi:hypothetical protein